MKKLLNLNFYKTAGFYVAVGSMISLLVAVLIYATGFKGELGQYYSASALAVAFVAVFVYLLLMLFKDAAPYSGFVYWVLALVSFLLFAKASYMYYSGVFYNGFSFSLIGMIEKPVMASDIFYLIALIAGNVAIYLKPYLVKKEEKVSENEEVTENDQKA